MVMAKEAIQNSVLITHPNFNAMASALKRYRLKYDSNQATGSRRFGKN